MTGEGRGEWLALLEAELARRSARVEWEADRAERAGQQLLAELAQMAQRLAALAPLRPIQIDDMSIAEMFACRFFLPEELMPAGLGTEDQIWAEYQRRRGG